jgi:hypothetical protein
MRAMNFCESRQKDPIQFPQEMKMVLKEKIQVANGLQTEFQKIMDNNMDSFN